MSKLISYDSVMWNIHVVIMNVYEVYRTEIVIIMLHSR